MCIYKTDRGTLWFFLLCNIIATNKAVQSNDVCISLIHGCISLYLRCSIACISIHLLYFYITVRPTVQSTISERHISELEDNPVTLTFSILNANPAVTTSQILWYFNGSVALRPLNTLFGNALLFSPNYRTLTISNVNYNIQGRISLVANNVVGGDSDYIDLTIEGSMQ